jgi:multidrug efflux pump subunit AcrA (membrane-fusion protein)
MRKRLRAISIIACQLIFAISLTACSGDSNKQAISNPVPVLVGDVQKVQEYETIFVSGTVSTPDSPAVVSFLVSGKVIFVGPREGDDVTKGQVLAQIDPTDFQLQLKIAQAQKDEAHAAMEKAMRSARPEVLEAARVAYERAEDEYRRKKMLYDSNSLAPNDFQKFKAAYETAKQQYEEAKAGGQKEDKELTRAAYDLADAHLQVAAKALSDATLHAPISGYIAKRAIEVGDTAAAGRPIFEIVQLDTVEANVGVPETDVHLVKIGQKASITFPALPNQSFQGTIRIINVAAEPATRTYMTRISVPNPGHVIKIGMVAEARIITDRKISTMTVPGRAIVRDAQGATMVFVYFPKERRVYSKRVEVGELYGTDVEIKEGLSGDESIVIGGQDYLRDGMSVTIGSPPAGDTSNTNRRTMQ